jgi:hypothetical protein
MPRRYPLITGGNPDSNALTSCGRASRLFIEQHDEKGTQ